MTPVVIQSIRVTADPKRNAPIEMYHLANPITLEPGGGKEQLSVFAQLRDYVRKKRPKELKVKLHVSFRFTSRGRAFDSKWFSLSVTVRNGEATYAEPAK